jgi:hypothetical protein
MTIANELVEIIRDLEDELSDVFEQMEWAEEEIEAAMRRHPDSKDLLFHSFKLLSATHSVMASEFVFRAHCRELLERVANGEDTRLATAAEVCCACHDASQLAPLTTSAMGLYVRMWAIAFPDKGVLGDNREHYEALKGANIDSLESESRRKLAVQDRLLDDIECTGQHHGKPVHCKYAG